MKSIAFLLITLTGLLASFPQFAAASDVLRADFAIYAPGTPDDGVWKTEVTALKAMLSKYGWSYQTVGAKEINSGTLGVGASKHYLGLIMPGGYVVPRLKSINLNGKANIQSFIRTGGNFIGFCAGTYYATENIEWAEVPNTYTPHHYPTALNLFPGRAIGPLEWAPWNHGTPPSSMETAEMNGAIPTLQTIGVPSRMQLYYFGGPYFKLSPNLPKDLEIWARAVNPRSSDARGAGQPTIIHFKYSKGNVVLFSYHPVIIPETLPEQDKTGVQYQSWNVLHAALQITSNQKVSAMPRR